MKVNVINTNKLRIKIFCLIVSLFLPLIHIPAISAGNPGEIADFKMRIDDEGPDILGTIVYRAGYIGNIYNTRAMDNAINESINIYFSNVKQFVSDGTTSDFNKYYWTADSKDVDIAKTEIMRAEYVDYPGNREDTGIGDAGCYLVLTPQSLGTVVINISVAANINMFTGELINPVTKTFTISIVDAAKHAEAEPTFVRIGGAAVSSPLKIGYITPVTISIDKLIAYDYSNLNSGSYFKNIANYNWHASLSEPDIIKINDADSISNQSVNGNTAVNGSTKNITITPLKEGTVDINFTFSPSDLAIISVFGDSIIYTMTVDVTKVVGTFDFTINSDRRAYGGTTATEDNKSSQSESDNTSEMLLEREWAYSNNNSAVDIIFQKPTEEPTTEAPTEPYDLNSAIDIMFQNKPQNQNDMTTTEPTTEKVPSLVPPANNRPNDFEPDLNSPVDIMFQTPTEPTTEAPTEPYDLNSPVDIMFQNKPPTPNQNQNTPNSSQNSLYSDAQDISGSAAGLNNYQGYMPSEVLIGGDSEVILTISDFRAQINGSWQNIGNDVPFEIKEISYKYPSKIINPSAAGSAITEVKISEMTDQLKLWEYNQAISLENKLDILIANIILQETFSVVVTITAEIHGAVKTTEKTFKVLYLSDEDNGSIANISLIQDNDNEINDKQTITGIIGRNQSNSILNFNINSIDIIDFGVEDNIVTIEDLHDYEFTVKSSSPNVVGVIIPELHENDGSTFKLELKKTGKANITVTVTGRRKNSDSSGTLLERELAFSSNNGESQQSSSTVNTSDTEVIYSTTFTVNVTDGVLSSEEGAIASAVLKYGNETIFNGKTELYMLLDSEINIEISKLTEFSSAATAVNKYTNELKDYRWGADSNNSIVVISEGANGSVDSSSAVSDKIIKITSGDVSGEAVIKIIFESEREGITSKELYEFTFKIVVTGIGGKFMPMIDYEQETLKIAIDISGGIYKFYEFDQEKGPEYMYCLKAASDGASQANEKWFPFMGSEMDISSFIPKSGSVPYRLGIRLANDIEREENGDYSASNRRVVVIPPRRVLSKSERSDIIYKNEQIMLSTPGANKIDVYYQVGLSGWLKATISGNSGISFPSSIAPTGAVVQIKYAAVKSDGAVSHFGSAPVKIRVPKASSKPNIKLNSKKGAYTGFTTKMEYSIDGTTWKESPKGAVTYGDVSSRFADLPQDEATGDYILYIRTKANYKKDGSLKSPASDIVALRFPKSAYTK